MKFLNILVLSAIAGFASAAAVPGPDTAVERDGGLVEKRCAGKKIIYFHSIMKSSVLRLKFDVCFRWKMCDGQ